MPKRGSHVGSWDHKPWVPGGRGHGGHAMDMGRVHGGGVRAGRAERAGMDWGPLKVVVGAMWDPGAMSWSP